MSNRRILKTRCGKCNTRLQVESHLVEKTVTCPKCGNTVTASRTSGPLPAAKPAGRLDHEFPCPNCESELKVNQQSIGTMIHCRACEHEILVPAPTSGADIRRRHGKHQCVTDDRLTMPILFLPQRRLDTSISDSISGLSLCSTIIRCVVIYAESVSMSISLSIPY